MADVAREFIAAKETAGLSEPHVRDLRYRLTRFAGSFSMNMAGITGYMLQTWLDAQPVGSHSKKNEWRIVSALIRFAVRRKYAPRDLLDELEAVQVPKVAPAPITLFSPDELCEMLEAAPPKLIPWLAVGAFCGLRSSEIQRLDWRNLDLQRRFLEVKAGDAKTAQRRLVPLCDAAIQWLQPFAQKEGHVSCYAKDNWFYVETVAAVNRARKAKGGQREFKWKRNGLRHSFCSYRLAVVKSAAQVALEAGNRPQMLFANCREVVSEQEGQRWFGVFPPRPAQKVVPMPAKEVA